MLFDKITYWPQNFLVDDFNEEAHWEDEYYN